jgi:DNA-binding LacI/PurR family transcriptional regulator
MAGFRRAMTEAGVPLAPEYLQEATFNLAGGHSKGSLLLRMLPRPTAIFAGNDMIAMGVLQPIHDLGLRCPQDISLVGFDDMDFAPFNSPSLTSVFQPGYQLGATAAQMLVDRVVGDESPARHVILQTQFKIRELIAAPLETPAARRNAEAAKKRKKKT